MPHDETLMTMKVGLFGFILLLSTALSASVGTLADPQIFDDIRSQGGYKYQAGLERVQLG